MILAVSISWMLALTLTTLVIFWLWTKYKRTYTQYNIPPFPVKPWPIFGHFFMMRRNQSDKLKAWRKMAGDIFSLDVGGQLQIVINDYNMIKEIWIKKADHIINTQVTFGNDLLGEHHNGIVGARDDNWKEQRTISLSILRSFGMGKNVMADKIDEEVSYVIEKLSSFKGRPEDIRLLLNISVSNVICSVTIGKRFDHEDPYFARFMIQLRDLVQYGRAVRLLTPFKYLYYLPGDLFDAKKWAKSATDINEQFSKVYVKELTKTFNEDEEPQNFVTGYIKEMKKLQKKGVKSNLSEANLIAIIRTLFLGGTETTSTSILWCLLYMLHNPEVQEKVYREIEVNVGTARTPNISDKAKLTYLNAVIMETQRMSSLVPIAFLREVSSSFEVGGYTFPKGSILWSMIDSVHYEKKIWGDPDNFRPERFIDQHGAIMNREELIPFHIGRRICLGEALAKMELFLFLSAIFQRFKIEPADKSGELPSLKKVYGGTVVPQPFTIRFIERKTT